MRLSDLPPVLRSAEGCRVGRNVWLTPVAQAVACALRDAASAIARGGIKRPHIRQCGHISVGFTSTLITIWVSGERFAVIPPNVALKFAEALDGDVVFSQSSAPPSVRQTSEPQSRWPEGA